MGMTSESERRIAKALYFLIDHKITHTNEGRQERKKILQDFRSWWGREIFEEN